MTSASHVPARILVTGGSGFLGQAFIRRMLDEGRTVVSLGRSRDGLDPRADFAEANLADPASLRAALRTMQDGPPPDALVHLAVSRHHREFPQKALDLFHVNAGSAAELLDFCCTAGVRSAVMGSTGTVYSTQTTSTEPEAPGDGEDIFRRPTSYFAASKLFADAMAELYRGLFPVAVLRLYAPYGPGLTGRMLNDLVARVSEGRPLSLPASGPGFGFAALYVDDALDIIGLALDQRWNETINVASPEAWTIESVGQLIGGLVGCEPSFERSTAASAPRVVPDLARLQALLPDHQFVGLEAGLRSMLAAAG
jgi:nucleoside-diphosphate-sugar epimerase